MQRVRKGTEGSYEVPSGTRVHLKGRVFTIDESFLLVFSLVVDRVRIMKRLSEVWLSTGRTILWASPTLRLARAIYSRLRKMLSRSGMLWMILLICLFSCVTGEWLRINKTYICKKLSPPQAKPYKLQPQHGLVWLPDPSWKGRSITCNRIRVVVIFVCPTPPTLPILPGMAKVDRLHVKGREPF